MWVEPGEGWCVVAYCGGVDAVDVVVVKPSMYGDGALYSIIGTDWCDIAFDGALLVAWPCCYVWNYCVAGDDYV